MVSHGRVELLAHPLSQKYLQMKWNSYGKYYHVANLLIYSVFLLFVTLFSAQLMSAGSADPLVVESTEKILNSSAPILQREAQLSEVGALKLNKIEFYLEHLTSL